MSWKQQWMNEVLREIPAGNYRRRVEAELSDHLESQCRTLTEAGRTPDEARAEALRIMGEPDKLREEYAAVWRRSLPGRLKELGNRLKTWAGGCAVMLGVHLLVSYVLSCIWWMALSLPGDSQDPWVIMIRGTVGNLNNSLISYLLPLVSALVVGAYYLGGRFQTSRRPAWQIIVGLSFHWAFIAAFQVWWESVDDHITFWEELKCFSTYGVGYYSLTLVFCVLLGLAFGYMFVRGKRSAAV